MPFFSSLSSGKLPPTRRVPGSRSPWRGAQEGGGAPGAPGPAVPGVPDLSGECPWSSRGTQLWGHHCLVTPRAAGQGLQELGAHGEGWDCSCSRGCVGPPCWGLRMGTKAPFGWDVPRRGARRGPGLGARPGHGQSMDRAQPGHGQSTARARPGHSQDTARAWAGHSQGSARHSQGMDRALPGHGQSTARTRPGLCQARPGHSRAAQPGTGSRWPEPRLGKHLRQRSPSSARLPLLFPGRAGAGRDAATPVGLRGSPQAQPSQPRSLTGITALMTLSERWPGPIPGPRQGFVIQSRADR